MEFNIFIFIIWLPFAIIFFKDVIWNLHLWENKEFRFDRFWIHIRWDFEPINRKTNLNVLKIIAFCLISTFLSYPILAVIGIFIAFVTWVIENFLFIEDLIKDQFRPINFLKLRNFLILVLVFVSLIAIITILSFPFTLLDRTGATTNAAVYTNSVLQGSGFYPDVFIYASLSFILAIFLDLASPLILAFFVIITSPISWILNQHNIYYLSKFITKNKEHLVVIMVSGGKERVLVKNLIFEIIKDKYLTLTFNNTFTSISNVAKAFLPELRNSLQIILLDVEGYRMSDFQKLGQVLHPDILVLSDINISNLGLFRNIKDYVQARLELLKYIDPEGILVYNADNKYCQKGSTLFEGEKVAFSRSNTKALKTKDLIQGVVSAKNLLKINHLKYDQEYSVNLTKTPDKQIILPAIAVAHELGINKVTVKGKLEKLDKLNLITTISGDQNSLIIYNNEAEEEYKNILSQIHYAQSLKPLGFKKVFLVTSGLKNLGRFKNSTYKKLIKVLHDNVNYLITTDTLLYKLALQDNYRLNVMKAADTDEMLYLIRKNLASRDMVIVEGPTSSEIIESLRSEE